MDGEKEVKCHFLPSFRQKSHRLANINENFRDPLSTLSKNTIAHSHTEYIKRVLVKSIGQNTFIPVDDIIYIEAADQYVEVHTEKKKYTVRESIDKLERNLDPRFFFRTHWSCIINLECALAQENVDKHISLVVLTNNRKVKMANNRKQDFKVKMNFWGG